MERDIIKRYLDIKETKSGILMENGKCVYLYGNICCEAKCARVYLRSEKSEICSEFAEGIIFIRNGDNGAIYLNSKKLLKVRRFILLYEIDFAETSMYGVFSGGSELLLADCHFTDKRISELIDLLIVGEGTAGIVSNKHLEELENVVRAGEVSALSELFLHGKPIDIENP